LIPGAARAKIALPNSDEYLEKLGPGVHTPVGPKSYEERTMTGFLGSRELARTNPAERAAFRSPVPTRMISDGEFNPLPQTPLG